MESTIRRPTVSPPQWSPKCSRCWSMPANICTPTTWLSLWPARTRNRNCVKVMVVGATYEITSSALIWPALEDSIRWVRLGEHQVMIFRQSSSSGIYDIHRIVSAAVALRTVWMLNVMLVTAQVSSVACAAVHVAVILQVAGSISVPCLVMFTVVVLDIITYSAHQMTWVQCICVGCFELYRFLVDVQLNLTNYCMDGMVYFRTVLLLLFRTLNYMYESLILSVSLIEICLRCLKSQNLCAAW